MTSNSNVKSILHLTLLLASALMIFSCNSSTQSTTETESSSGDQDLSKYLMAKHLPIGMATPVFGELTVVALLVR